MSLPVWISRASLLLAGSAALWAALVGPRGARLTRMLLALLAVACWRSNRQLLVGLSGALPLARARSRENGESRWACLAGSLPAGTVAGYVGPVPREEIAVNYGYRSAGNRRGSLPALQRFMDAEGALAPVVVVNRNDPTFLFGDFEPGRSPQALFAGKYVLVQRCESGVALYRRVP